MTDHDHNHGDSDPNSSAAMEARARALQSLLIEKGLISTDAIETIISSYEEDVGPQNGARVVAKAWTDERFKELLLEKPKTAIEQFEFEIGNEHIKIVENTPQKHNIVVCTLCSCYPWSLLGLPPTWYKSPEYRARVPREPRAVIAEFGVELDSSVSIQVWDSTAEIRYLVLPQQPPETEGLPQNELLEYITRDSMIGTERLV